MARTAIRRRREKEDRKEAILAAARKVFFESGIHRATVDEIAAEAEVAKGTVYLYFETKETILAHLLLEGLDTLVGTLHAAYGEDEELSAETRLRRMAEAYLHFAREQADYFRLMMAFDRSRFQESVTPEVYQLILLRSVRGLRWLVRAVDQGIRDGEFEFDNARNAAGMFWAAINGVLVLISHPLRRELLEQEVETLYADVTDTMLRGMKRAK